MLIAYWYKDGLDLYEIKEGRVNALSHEALSPIKYLPKKRILIVSKELLFQTRRKYPPTPLSKLKRAVKLEISQLFSIPEPDFYCRVFESTEKSIILDIWAWQKDEYSNIRKIFPFQYVIPEDILWIDEGSVLNIFQRKGIYHLIASSKKRFLGTLSLAYLTQKEIELFLTGLYPLSEEIEKVKIYGDILPEIKLEREIQRLSEPDYPACLERISQVNLKDFKVKGYLPFKKDLLIRIPIFAFIAYAAFLFFTAQNYETSVADLKNKIAELDRKISSLEGKTQKDYTSLISEINKKVSETVSPLTLMDNLAQRLPVGCVVNRFVLNEKNLEITLSYENPLDVLNFLESAPMIKSVKMKGAPIKRTGTKAYDFTLTLELDSDIKG